MSHYLIYRHDQDLYEKNKFLVYCDVATGGVYQVHARVENPQRFENDPNFKISKPFDNATFVVIKLSNGERNPHLAQMVDVLHLTDKDIRRLWKAIEDYEAQPEECLRRWHPFYRQTSPTFHEIDPGTWRCAIQGVATRNHTFLPPSIPPEPHRSGNFRNPGTKPIQLGFAFQLTTQRDAQKNWDTHGSPLRRILKDYITP